MANIIYDVLNIEVEWLLRILIAAICGGLIGYERHSRSKEAGIRTHTIVALASAMAMLLSKYGFDDTMDYDAARIAAQVISGVGFIGAGIIFVRNDTIQGLTTAAGIWATAGIGMCIGAGLYGIGLFSTILIVLIQSIFQRRIFAHAPRTTIRLLVRIKKEASIKDITNEFRKYGYYCSENHMIRDPNNLEEWALVMEASTLQDVEPAELLKGLRKSKYIKSIDLAE